MGARRVRYERRLLPLNLLVIGVHVLPWWDCAVWRTPLRFANRAELRFTNMCVLERGLFV